MSLLDWYMLAFDETRFSFEWKRTKRAGPNAMRGAEDEVLNIVRETA
jgi:hypothetical protein